MADTAVAITAGTGTNIDTRTEGTNGNHRQVVVLGDPATNAGVAPVDATAGLKVDLGADNDVAVSSIAAGDNNIGNVDVVTLPALPAGNNNIGDVDIASIAAGTNNIGDVDVASIAAGDNNIGNVDIVTMPNVTLAAGTNTNEVVGDIADDTGASGNPVSIGGYAIQTDGTDPGSVSAEDDVTRLRTDMNRLLIVNQTHPRFWHVSADYGAAQTNASVKAAPGASLSLYLTDIMISNGATAGNVTLLDGSGGTVLLELYPAINGGAVLSLRSPIKLTANTALCITSTTVTTHSIFVSGYIAP